MRCCRTFFKSPIESWSRVWMQWHVYKLMVKVIRLKNYTKIKFNFGNHKSHFTHIADESTGLQPINLLVDIAQQMDFQYLPHNRWLARQHPFHRMNAVGWLRRKLNRSCLRWLGDILVLRIDLHHCSLSHNRIRQKFLPHLQMARREVDYYLEGERLDEDQLVEWLH